MTMRRGWDESYAALMKYKDDYGDCLVPASYQADTALGHWVRKQRRYETNGELPKGKKKKLDKLGFVWKLRDANTTSAAETEKPLPPTPQPPSHRSKKKRRRSSSVSNTTTTSSSSNKKLKKSSPSSHTRTARATTSSITTTKRKSLPSKTTESPATASSIKGANQAIVQQWEENYALVKKYYAKHGNCLITRREDKTLSYWVSRQRTLYHQKKLKPDRKKMLDEIPFEWYPGTQQQSNDTYNDTIEQEDEEGDENNREEASSTKESADDVDMVASPESVSFREPVDVPELPYDFVKMLGHLLEYRQKFGDVDVPYFYNVPKGLGEWVDCVKHRARYGKLTPTQANMLLRIGFTWLEDRNLWLYNLRKVSDQVKKHHRIPRDCDHWLQIQFLLIDFDLLPTKRKTQLDALGILWDGRDYAWVEEPLTNNYHAASWMHPGDEESDNDISDTGGFHLQGAAMAWAPTKGTPPRGEGKTTLVTKRKTVSSALVVSPNCSFSTTDTDANNGPNNNDRQTVVTPTNEKEAVIGYNTTHTSLVDDTSSTAVETATSMNEHEILEQGGEESGPTQKRTEEVNHGFERACLK